MSKIRMVIAQAVPVCCKKLRVAPGPQYLVSEIRYAKRTYVVIDHDLNVLHLYHSNEAQSAEKSLGSKIENEC